VVSDRKTLAKLAETHPHGKILSSAAAAIAVCGDTTVAPDFWVQDCAAATENMLIAVAALGLGAIWLGGHPREDRVAAIREALGIPGNAWRSSSPGRIPASTSTPGKPSNRTTRYLSTESPDACSELPS
jgi:nitroreductase